jgi:hypothetical protein
MCAIFEVVVAASAVVRASSCSANVLSFFKATAGWGLFSAAVVLSVGCVYCCWFSFD